jgi:hypothetical protein
VVVVTDVAPAPETEVESIVTGSAATMSARRRKVPKVPLI